MTDDAFHGLVLGLAGGGLVLAVWLLAGCAPYKTEYPNVCDISQPDKDGKGGYTKGQFPCKLRHHEGGMP